MQNDPFDQIDPIQTPPKPKMSLGKVVLINFGIMIAYMMLNSLTVTSGSEAALRILIADAMLILAQIGLNILIGLILVFTEDHKQLGDALLIGGVIMGVIGFGSCHAHATIFYR